MNEQIYFTEGNRHHGPLTLEQLRSRNLSANVLVWYDGLMDWTPINEAPLTASILSEVPPQIPIAEDTRPQIPIAEDTPPQIPIAEDTPPQIFYQKPDSYLAGAIFSTIFCFFPLGIVAIVKSLKVNKLYGDKKYKEAELASKKALKLIELTITIGFFVLLLNVILSIIISLSK